MAINALERIAEDIDSFKKSTIYSDMAADYAEAASSYGRYADDINKTLAKSRDKLIREIEKEIKVLGKEPKYGRKIAEEYGGLNQESWLRTADMSNTKWEQICRPRSRDESCSAK